MKLLIVSGTSGSGKSIALQALEDLGFYCIDNLPAGLLPVFATQIASPSQHGYDDAAVGVDARNLTADFREFQSMLTRIRTAGLDVKIFFLDADDEILLKRFSETRRRHPLTRGSISLREAIEAERALLSPLQESADWQIDTSRTTIHQLRDLIRERVAVRSVRGLSLLFLSFGFKFGNPSDADVLFDTRCLPNPHWDPALRSKTGRDPEVKAFLDEQPLVARMCDDIYAYLEAWLPAYERENRSYMTVAIGCTGGQHRSVYVAEKLTERFRDGRANVMVRHRELG